MDKSLAAQTVKDRLAGLDLGVDQKSGLKSFWSILFQLLQIAAAGWFLWFYFKTVRADWGEIVRYGFHPQPLWFSLGALLLLLGHSWQPTAFWLNFKLSGVSVALRDSYKLYSMAHLAHYLPGRIWSYLSFAYLGSFLDIAPAQLLAALYLGFAASLFSGSVFSVFALPLFKPFTHPYLVLAICLAALSVLFIPAIFHSIIKLFAKVVRTRMAELPQPFRFKAILLSSFSYGISWFLNSAGVVLLVVSFHPLTFQQTLFSFSVFALAYLVGYLAFFTAGGLGVREGVMLVVLSNFVPMYVAATVPLAARLLSMSVEGLWFLVVFKMPWKNGVQTAAGKK